MAATTLLCDGKLFLGVAKTIIFIIKNTFRTDLIKCYIFVCSQIHMKCSIVQKNKHIVLILIKEKQCWTKNIQRMCCKKDSCC